MEKDVNSWLKDGVVKDDGVDYNRPEGAVRRKAETTTTVPGETAPKRTGVPKALQSDALEARYDLGEFFNVLRQYKYALIIFLVLGAGIAYAVTKRFLPPVFEASVDIFDNSADSKNPFIMSAGSGGKWSAEQIKLVIDKRIKHNLISNIAEAYPDMSPEVRDKLILGSPSVFLKNKIITLRIRSQESKYLPELVYLMAEDIIDAEKEHSREQTGRMKDYLVDRAAEEERAYTDAKKAMVDYLVNDATIRETLAEDGISDYKRFKQSLLSKLDRFRSKLETAVLDHRAAKNKLEEVRLSLVGERETIEVVPSDAAELNRITDRLIELTILRLELLTTFTPESQEIQDIDRRIAQLSADGGKSLQRYMKKSSKYSANPRKQELMMEELTAKWDMNIKSREIEALEKDIDELENKVTAMRGVDAKYEVLSAELEHLRRSRADSKMKAQELAFQESKGESYYEIALDKDVLDTSLADAAKNDPKKMHLAYEGLIPVAKIGPNLPRNIVLGLGAALLLWLGMVYYIELTEKRIRKPGEIRTVLGLKPLGVFLKKSKDFIIVDAKQKPTALAEAYHVLNNTVQYAFPTERNKVLLVTSSFQGEGKTVTAVNIAISAALDGKKVLLLDADLRNGKTHIHLEPHLQGPKPEAGLTDYLKGEAGAKNVILPTKIKGLYWLPTGPYMDNPSKYLAGGRMTALLEYISTKCDFVVVDCTPVLPVVDTTVIAPYVDGVLLAIGFKSVRKQFARETLERLMHVNAPVIGAIITMTPKRTSFVPSYGYTYYHKLYR